MPLASAIGDSRHSHTSRGCGEFQPVQHPSAFTATGLRHGQDQRATTQCKATDTFQSTLFSPFTASHGASAAAVTSRHEQIPAVPVSPEDVFSPPVEVNAPHRVLRVPPKPGATGAQLPPANCTPPASPDRKRRQCTLDSRPPQRNNYEDGSFDDEATEFLVHPPPAMASEQQRRHYAAARITTAMKAEMDHQHICAFLLHVVAKLTNGRVGREDLLVVSAAITYYHNYAAVLDREHDRAATSNGSPTTPVAPSSNRSFHTFAHPASANSCRHRSLQVALICFRLSLKCNGRCTRQWCWAQILKAATLSLASQRDATRSRHQPQFPYLLFSSPSEANELEMRVFIALGGRCVLMKNVTGEVFGLLEAVIDALSPNPYDAHTLHSTNPVDEALDRRQKQHSSFCSSTSTAAVTAEESFTGSMATSPVSPISRGALATVGLNDSCSSSVCSDVFEETRADPPSSSFPGITDSKVRDCVEATVNATAGLCRRAVEGAHDGLDFAGAADAFLYFLVGHTLDVVAQSLSVFELVIAPFVSNDTDKANPTTGRALSATQVDCVCALLSTATARLSTDQNAMDAVVGTNQATGTV